ncbi:type III pantothenate kinase [Ostreibacterium oceani]|uniref:Type III pantothenate kinase n=1 Tax=Ostreibacterium oceani TaxID=2654998 RepID=A0A6N7EXL0_9GAMM|nr:type III pantothenate kinase [Ostreibacterium oceani]MPV86325.1 type III pantothenate kinase [Ostreibacterium oceani]
MHGLIDVGNTRIKYLPHAAVALNACQDYQAIMHDQVDVLIEHLAQQNVSKITIASVRALPVTQRLIDWAAHHQITLQRVQVNPTYLAVNYRHVDQFGVDRYLGLLAAKAVHQQNFCVVSAGSAITLDFFGQTHLGGMILPGIGTSLSCLQEKTGLASIREPDALLGNDTASSIGAGIYQGYSRLVAASIADVSAAYQQSFQVVLTGGDADYIAKYLTNDTTKDATGATKDATKGGLLAKVTIKPNLVFEGMHVYLSMMENGAV